MASTLNIVLPVTCAVTARRVARHLAEYGVLAIEVIRAVQCDEELAAVVVGAIVRHGNNAAAREAKALVEFILTLSCCLCAHLEWSAIDGVTA